MDQLPVELLSNVFYWATYSPIRDSHSSTFPQHFESVTSANEDDSSLLALTVKRTLSLVCWRWNALSTPFLFEELWIRHGTVELANSLERSQSRSASAGVRPHGEYVVRIFLPVECIGRFEDTVLGKQAQRIFRCCPNIRVLIRSRNFVVRPETWDSAQISPGLTREASDEPLELSKLVRVDWGRRWECWEPDQLTIPPKYCFDSSSLQILSIGPSNGAWSSSYGKPGGNVPPIYLPNVHTLHLLSAWSSAEDLAFRAVELPSLRRLITETPFYNYENLLALNAQRIRSVEFGKASEFLRTRCVSRVLELCDNLEELYFPLFYTNYTVLHSTASLGRCLKRVGIHSAPNEAMNVIDCGRGRWDSNYIWWHLDRVFAVFSGAPAAITTQFITLYGTDWYDNVDNLRLVKALEKIRDKNIVLAFEDPRVELKLLSFTSNQ